jgi:hypothetical protein
MRSFLRILMLLALLSGTALLAQTTTLDFGDTVQGMLTTAETAIEYTFAGEQGQFVSITMTRVDDDVDPYLRLLDANGRTLAEDDDSAGNLNSRIGPYRLPANGTYTIVATSLSGSDLGLFDISLQTTTVRRLEYGQMVTGELSAETPTVDYTFSASADDIVSIDLESDDFDSYLTLSAASPSRELTYNDDGGMNLNARIGPYQLTEAGDYVVTVSALGSSVGKFRLTLNQVLANPLAFNEPAEALISGGQARYFTFEGRAGQVIDLRVDSGGKLDTELSLIGPSSSQVASNDDYGGALDPALVNTILNEDGTYFVAVQPSVSRDAQTPVVIKLTESLLPALDEGPQTILFGDLTTNHMLTFNGVQGEQVRIHLEIASGEALSPNVRVSQNGQEIASLSTYTITQYLSFGVSIPADGLVVIDVVDYNYLDVEVTVTLERQAASG